MLSPSRPFLAYFLSTGKRLRVARAQSRSRPGRRYECGFLPLSCAGPEHVGRLIDVDAACGQLGVPRHRLRSRFHTSANNRWRTSRTRGHALHQPTWTYTGRTRATTLGSVLNRLVSERGVDLAPQPREDRTFTKPRAAGDCLQVAASRLVPWRERYLDPCSDCVLYLCNRIGLPQ